MCSWPDGYRLDSPYVGNYYSQSNPFRLIYGISFQPEQAWEYD